MILHTIETIAEHYDQMPHKAIAVFIRNGTGSVYKPGFHSMEESQPLKIDEIRKWADSRLSEWNMVALYHVKTFNCFDEDGKIRKECIESVDTFE